MAALVMNDILGGHGFNARLMKRLRDQEGLTYGAYSSFMDLSGAHVLRASFSTQNETAQKALSLLKEEWGLLARKGVSESEVDDSISYLTGSLPLRLTSTESIAAVLNSLQRLGFGPDYLAKRQDLLQSVTVSDVNRVAGERLKPKDLITVLVGDPEGITPDVIQKVPSKMGRGDQDEK